MQNNRLIILFATIHLLFALLGWYINKFNGFAIALGIAIIFSLLSYFYSTKFILKIYNAQKTNSNDNVILANILSLICNKVKIAEPKLYLIENDQPNIFNVGVNKKSFTIVISNSLIEILTNDEIEAVLASQIALIGRNITPVMTVIAFISSFLSSIAYKITFANKMPVKKSNNILVTIIMFMLSPLLALLMRFFISVKFKFDSDQIAGKITGKPVNLATALHKINLQTKKFYNIPAERYPGTSHLFLVNPLKKSLLGKIINSHPKITTRIQLLINYHEKINGTLSSDLAFLKKISNN